MASDGKIVFEVDVDGKNVKGDLSSITRDIESETKKWDGAVSDTSDNIGANLVDAFKTVTASAAFVQIGRMLVQLGGESIGLASDLEEVQNVVDVTFGDEGAATIEKWAKSAADSFGLTELQAKKYTSTIGAMLKSSGLADGSITDMSTSLAGLTADMSSFYNYGFDEMFQKISAGLAGETEPLRRLGINMSVANLEAFALANGMEASFNEMSQAEQIMLRYNYLLNATTDAQGDFARTSDSFANSQRRMATGFDTLKAQLGEALLPIATTVSNAVNDLLDVLTYQPPETAFDVAGDAMEDAVENATKAQGILGYMDKLYEKYGNAAENTEEWATALEHLKKVFPDVNQFIDAETGALTASNEQLKDYVKNSKEAAIEAAKQNAIKSLNEQYVQAGKDYYTAEINRDIANAQADEAAMALIDYIIEGFKKQGIGQEEETAYLLDRDQWREGLSNGNISMKDLVFEAEGVANAFGDNYDMIERYASIYQEQTNKAKEASATMASLSETITSLETDLAIANAALDKLATAAGAASDRLAGVTGSNGSFASGLDYVPWDGFMATLHKGERIQTATEAGMFRAYMNQEPGFDVSTFGAAMRDNIKPGGNVYLDGRIVGSVISDQQGKSFRQLQRSGWQS